MPSFQGPENAPSNGVPPERYGLRMVASWEELDGVAVDAALEASSGLRKAEYGGCLSSAASLPPARLPLPLWISG